MVRRLVDRDGSPLWRLWIVYSGIEKRMHRSRLGTPFYYIYSQEDHGRNVYRRSDGRLAGVLGPHHEHLRSKPVAADGHERASWDSKVISKIGGRASEAPRGEGV